jgi:hypothetical protein
MDIFMSLPLTHPKLIAVKALENFSLDVRFDSGEIGLLDVKPYLDFGVFTRLRDPHVFAQAKISFDTIEWPCGVDLDPAFVYAKSQPYKTNR